MIRFEIIWTRARYHHFKSIRCRFCCCSFLFRNRNIQFVDDRLNGWTAYAVYRQKLITVPIHSHERPNNAPTNKTNDIHSESKPQFGSFPLAPLWVLLVPRLPFHSGWEVISIENVRSHISHWADCFVAHLIWGFFSVWEHTVWMCEWMSMEIFILVQWDRSTDCKQRTVTPLKPALHTTIMACVSLYGCNGIHEKFIGFH